MAGERPSAPIRGSDEPTVSVIIAGYARYAARYYYKNGQPRSELDVPIGQHRQAVGFGDLLIVLAAWGPCEYGKLAPLEPALPRRKDTEVGHTGLEPVTSRA